MPTRDLHRETLSDLIADQLCVGHRVPDGRHEFVLKALLAGHTNHCVLHLIEGFRVADQIVIVGARELRAVRVVHLVDRRTGRTRSLSRRR